jgi:hypothetical protein
MTQAKKARAEWTKWKEKRSEAMKQSCHRKAVDAGMICTCCDLRVAKTPHSPDYGISLFPIPEAGAGATRRDGRTHPSALRAVVDVVEG